MHCRLALFCLLLSACSTGPNGHEPSLAPRAAEAIDPRVPIPSEVVAGPADPALLARISELMAEVHNGDAAFQAAAQNAQALAASAGPAQSESWIAAQQAISALVASRAPVTRAISDLDGLASSRLMASGGILPGDLQAIQSASAEAGAIGNSEAALISRLQQQIGA